MDELYEWIELYEWLDVDEYEEFVEMFEEWVEMLWMKEMENIESHQHIIEEEFIKNHEHDEV